VAVLSSQQWKMFFSSMADIKCLVAVCHSFCLFFIFLYIHTIIQSHSYNTFAEVSLHLLIACKLSGTDLPVVPSRESNSGLPSSKPTRYQLSHAAPLADMAAARQHAREFIMEVVAVLSSQQWQLFSSSMADMPAARQHAGEFIMAFVAVLLAAMAADLQQHGRYACCSSACSRRVNLWLFSLL
jgi:hypothetical protein